MESETWSQAQGEIDLIITAWTSGRTRAPAVDLLRGAGVPAVPVLDAADRIENARFSEREVLLPHDGDWLKGYPLRFTAYEPPVPAEAPGVGQDTHRALTELAGLGPERMQALEEAGVLPQVEHSASQTV